MTDSPRENPDRDELIALLAGTFDRATAVELINDLVNTTSGPEPVTQVLELLDELKEASSKSSQGAVEALTELRRRGALEVVVPWLDLGVALAGSSGAAALKYFKESPLVLGLIESAEVRGQVLMQALELAESDPNVALEWFRKAPELLTILPADQLAAWAEVGVELAGLDYVLGIEFFRQSPAIAQVIPLALVRTWVGFGTKLITQNSLGKTDYLGTLEFFRTSPAILGEVEGAGVKQAVVELGSVIADHSPPIAIACLAEAPTILRRLPSEEWRTKVLQYGVLLAERDAEAAIAYLRRCPEILGLIVESTPTQPSPSPVATGRATGTRGEGKGGAEKFEDWYRSGMEILEYSPEGARAYFALETRKALASIEQAISGVPLRQIARSIKLFAQGLCGTDVTIRSLPDSDPAGQSAPESLRATVSPDGRTIALPVLLRRYPTREENIRLYLVMTAHEAGHLEFGTYHVRLSRLADLVEEVRRRYGRTAQAGKAGQPSAVETLAQVFEFYPQPGIVRDLWTVLEDARVEFRLQHEYPGLKRDLTVMAREAVRTRSLTHGLSVREMIVDCLLLLTTAEPGTVRVPDSIADIVDRLWALCQRILTPTASAEETIRLVDRLYLMMDEMLAVTASDVGLPKEQASDHDLGPGPKASEEISGQYRPVTNWVYRGAMHPDMVRDRGGDAEGGLTRTSSAEESGGQAPALAHQEGLQEPVPTGAPRLSGRQAGDALGPGQSPGSTMEQMLTVGSDLRKQAGSGGPEDRGFVYDEWDGMIQDYRSGWCRVVERMAPEGSRDFAEAVLAAHGPAVRLLRRYFESIRPPGLRRVHGQTDGEELDLDASIRRIADRAAGAEPSDRIYVRREKRERDVAAAFLVDLSGSTSRQIESAEGSSGLRVIDVEKEGLVLLCAALEAIGDRYGIYGYSGRGRGQVDFVVLKEFDEPTHGRTAQRIGSIVPMHQNRDGAAIRHAVQKLLAQQARVKLLVLISDGRPLDDGYADEYALEDTKMALREARVQGIEPFCITVDRDADDYLRRMYGEVRYLIIDHVAALPERLPRVYQRLTT